MESCAVEVSAGEAAVQATWLSCSLFPPLPRVIVAPITSKGQPLGCRPELTFQDKPARILLDQIRCIDKKRLAGRMGEIDVELWHDVLMQMLA